MRLEAMVLASYCGIIKNVFMAGIAFCSIGQAWAGSFSKVHGPYTNSSNVLNNKLNTRSDASNIRLSSSKPDPFKPTPFNPVCVYRAALAEHVPLTVMYAIMKTEGGSIGTSHLNYDGSHDLGPMQINGRTWAGILARDELDQDNRSNRHIIRHLLKFNGCFNVSVGAWVLRGYYDAAGGSSSHPSPQAWAQAVGWYNSHDPIAMRIYQSKFRRNFVDMVNSVMGAGLK